MKIIHFQKNSLFLCKQVANVKIYADPHHHYSFPLKEMVFLPKKKKKEQDTEVILFLFPGNKKRKASYCSKYVLSIITKQISTGGK